MNTLSRGVKACLWRSSSQPTMGSLMSGKFHTTDILMDSIFSTIPMSWILFLVTHRPFLNGRWPAKITRITNSHFINVEEAPNPIPLTPALTLTGTLIVFARAR